MDEQIHEQQPQPKDTRELVAIGKGGGGSRVPEQSEGKGQLAEGQKTEKIENSEDTGETTKIARVKVSKTPPPPVAPTPDVLALQRNRLNRHLTRKRRFDRAYTKGLSIGGRLLIVAAALFALVLILFSSAAGGAYAYYQSQLPVLDGLANHTSFQTTHIYDRNGTLLYQFYSHNQNEGRRTYINYKDIAPVMVNATIAAEDHSFWTNSGVDYNRIIGAAVADLSHHGIVQGASTITEQLVDYEYLNNVKGNVQAKGEEAILATGMTQRYPKWKIMEMYLNAVYYGDLNYGVEAAAENYFRIQPKCTKQGCIPAVSQLDLAQASLLAGLPQSPSYYDPVVNKSVAMQRQQVVLEGMLSLKMITQKQMNAAQAETAKFTFEPYSQTHNIQAPHFVNYVIDNVLIPEFGDKLLMGGYNIYTTLDLTLEKKVESIVYDKLYNFQNDWYFGPYGPLVSTNHLGNAAVVVENPQNGEILAMDGSAKYGMNTPQMQGQDNAALALRQPGSSFKPIVYSTAFEMGWYPGMIIPDHKTYYPTIISENPLKYYSPQNYDGTFHTSYPITVRTALANSYNIPAVDAIEFTGIPNVLNMASRLGLKEVANQNPANLGPSMAIGAKEVSLLDMTGAYATFANNGVRTSQISVLEITNNQGQVLYKYDPNHPQQIRAMDPGVAYEMNSILSDYAARHREFPAGNPLEMPFPAAAKTGTTDSFRDNWTMGYSPHIAVGVWAGNSDNSMMTQNTIGIAGAGPIWHDVMQYVTSRYNFPSDNFPVPSDVHQGTISAVTGLLPRAGEPTITDWFLDGTMPTIYSSGYTATPNPTNPVNPCYGENCNPTNPTNPINPINPILPVGPPVIP